MSVTTNVPASVEELAERYNTAWGDHDLEAILALQTPDSEFRVHGTQELMSWKGIDACREAYGYLLTALPDQQFESHTLVVKEDFYICHHFVTGTFVLPWQMAGRVYEPTGKPVRFEILDTMHCEGNLVKLKDGWVDGLALHNQLTGAA
jgi:predicted ester cyclase